MKRRELNTGLLIGIGIAGLAIALVVGGSCVVGVWWLAKDRPPDVQPTRTATGNERKPYTREEFKALVMGKTPDEVIAAIGRPDKTWDDGKEWSYDGITIDPITGKRDYVSSIEFKDGKVARVRFT